MRFLPLSAVAVALLALAGCGGSVTPFSDDAGGDAAGESSIVEDSNPVPPLPPADGGPSPDDAAPDMNVEPPPPDGGPPFDVSFDDGLPPFDGSFDGSFDSAFDGASDSAFDGAFDGGPPPFDSGFDGAFDGGPFDSGPPPGDGGTCNALLNTAAWVTSTNVMGTAPAGTGGVIASGTYHLTGMTFFSSSTAFPTVTTRVTARVAGAVFEATHQDSTESGDSTSTYTTLGNRLSITQTCPMPQSTMMDYTATPTSLVLYIHFNEAGFNGTLRYTMSKI